MAAQMPHSAPPCSPAPHRGGARAQELLTDLAKLGQLWNCWSRTHALLETVEFARLGLALVASMNSTASAVRQRNACFGKGTFQPICSRWTGPPILPHPGPLRCIGDLRRESDRTKLSPPGPHRPLAVPNCCGDVNGDSARARLAPYQLIRRRLGPGVPGGLMVSCPGGGNLGNP